jgi:ribokinase
MGGRIFVFGSINTDLVVYLERLPRPGETVSGGRYASFPGGKGANQAVAASRAGAAVELFGCLGDDPFGRERLASLGRAGISTRGVRILAGVHSGIAQIMVDAAGENTIAVAPGANTGFSADGIEIPPARPGERCVSLFQNEVPMQATEQLISRAAAAGHTVLWNLAPTIERRPESRALAAVDYLICNRNELAALIGGADLGVDDAVSRALGWGVRNLVVTLGREGSLCAGEAGTVRQEAFPVEAVDTVGAGDCFCGVFAVALSEGADTREALRRAAAAAALSCTRRGAQDSMPLRAEIDDFLRSRRG